MDTSQLGTDLSAARLVPLVAAALATHPTLSEWRANNCDVGDAGLAGLAAHLAPGAFARLEGLGLNNGCTRHANRITDAGCATLVGAIDRDALPLLWREEMDAVVASLGDGDGWLGNPANRAAIGEVEDAVGRARDRQG